jgi:hypothetical protein
MHIIMLQVFMTRTRGYELNLKIRFQPIEHSIGTPNCCVNQGSRRS